MLGPLGPQIVLSTSILSNFISTSFVGTTGPTDCIVYFNSFKFCLNFICWDHWAHRLHLLLQYLQILSQLHLLGPLGPQTPFVTSIVSNFISTSFVGTTGPTDSICYFNSFKFCLNFICWDHWAHRLHLLLQYFQILSQLHLLGPLGPQTPFITSIVSNFVSTSFVGTTGPTDCIVYFNSFKFCLNFICWDHWAHRLHLLLQ